MPTELTKCAIYMYTGLHSTSNEIYVFTPLFLCPNQFISLWLSTQTFLIARVNVHDTRVTRAYPRTCNNNNDNNNNKQICIAP